MKPVNYERKGHTDKNSSINPALLTVEGSEQSKKAVSEAKLLLVSYRVL